MLCRLGTLGGASARRLALGRPTLQRTIASADFLSTKLEQCPPARATSIAGKLGHRLIGVRLPSGAGELKIKLAYTFA